MSLMEATGPGIFWNDIQTMKQVCVEWDKIATILQANGYCAIINEEIGKRTNRIARIDSPDWQDWLKDAHVYRMTFSEEVYGVPDQIMQCLHTSEESKHVGYVKTDIIHPKDGKCTVNWLQHVAKTPLPNWNTPTTHPKNASAIDTSREVAALLKEEGWRRVEGTHRLINIYTMDSMVNTPQSVVNKLPEVKPKDNIQ